MSSKLYVCNRILTVPIHSHDFMEDHNRAGNAEVNMKTPITETQAEVRDIATLLHVFLYKVMQTP
jgi:hypothetical protein